MSRKEAVAWLKKVLKPGSTVYTVLRHVSKSGMSRRIDLYAVKNNKPLFLTGWAGDALGLRHDRKGGLVVGGCGMDMGFHLVYELSCVLFPRGFKVKAGTAHRNGTPDGATDTDGGYALHHEWL
jgi:hypothetical protein